ncbi:MAG TPA: hypothetical protein VFP65_03090 [Anaeromyxobacteraceae bacterium]|nr:hypothetical protein [Anaeromyxobacteraceae bacterium]
MRSRFAVTAASLLAGLTLAVPTGAAAQCARIITADVVAIDQPLMFNRLGASNVNGMAFALRRDTVALACSTVNNVTTCTPGRPLNDPAAVPVPGQVVIRPDKRPRPLVLRAAAGDCLAVTVQNLLFPFRNPRGNAGAVAGPTIIDGVQFNTVVDDQVADRHVGFHAQGMQLVGSIMDDSSNVGLNASSLIAPGGRATYTFYAEREGTFLVTSDGATFGGEGGGGNTGQGLFAVINVEPKRASFYRSQVTEEELRLASSDAAGNRRLTAAGQPIIDYEAKYPAIEPWKSEGKAGLPILDMLTAANELVHSDLNAVIAGPGSAAGVKDGRFPADTYPLESVGKRNPTLPNRLEAFREYTVAFHDEMTSTSAFPGYFKDDPVFRHTLHAVGDVFMINYGSGAIGPEVVANRLGVGPMHDCLSCAYEEFFLTSHAVGDPAMNVDLPANVGLELCSPGIAPGVGACAAVGPKATRAFYPDDPSNVHHSYINDFVKFRNVHTGKEHHIFHLHNHQWLYNPNDDNSNYLDAQGIGPGAGYTYEINFGGSGNRNKSAGDAIFHCHFYPHFAQGMWELWRNHDVLETGTPLAVSQAPNAPGVPGALRFHQTPWALQDGTPAAAAVDASGKVTARARALPDGEVVAGTPIPALLPLPGKPMAVMPGKVTVVAKPLQVKDGLTGQLRPGGSNILVDRSDVDAGLVTFCAANPADVRCTLNPKRSKNPGYPMWIGGMEATVGNRPPTPPLDMAARGVDPRNGGWDGGLPRHSLQGYAAGGAAVSTVTRLDMNKELRKARAYWVPEDGNDVEKVAMSFHAFRTHASTRLNLDGTTAPGDFVTNGSGRPVPGAPFHDPCIDDQGKLLNSGVVGAWFDGIGGTSIAGSSAFTADNPRVYKAAVIQFDAVLNKAGYHYPQERIITLWEDAVPTINKLRPPEPFVLRANTFDCTMFLHTNLVPRLFELDDFQVRTPTDVIGQHIHLPKWDLTTTDGSANGWNYEDGTLSPDAVRERIDAINALNPTGAGNPPDSAGRAANTPLTARPHPFFGAGGPGGVNWMGARTTLERWFFDPVVNVAGVHRGLGIIFTHDHFGPSTHQQIGLYATVLAEPPASTWVHNETGVPFYTRADGGPTSWQAAILTGDLDGDGQNDSFREFYLEYSDFQHAYQPGTYVGVGQFGGPTGAIPVSNTTFRQAINPSNKGDIALAANPLTVAETLPDLIVIAADCPGGVPRPCPEAIAADDPGMMVVNYRNEPLALRVFDPAKLGPDGKPGMQADGDPGDLALALQSRTDRKVAAMNVQPAGGTGINGTLFPPGLNAGLTAGDPYTPMLRAYFGDRIRVKVQAGGDEETHNVSLSGLKWLQGGSGFGYSPTSGWRSSQQAGISEQLTFASPAMPLMTGGNRADHFYAADASHQGWWTGTWGITRMYGTARADLFQLPNTRVPMVLTNLNQFNGVCPLTAPARPYDVTAVLANDVLPNLTGAVIVPTDDSSSATMHVGGPLNPAGGTLVYNARPIVVSNGKKGPLHDPTAMMYVMTSDLVPRNAADPGCKRPNGTLDPTLSTCGVKLADGAPVEPIILRAAAGDCIQVTLRNRLPALAPDLGGYMQQSLLIPRNPNDPLGVTTFNNNLVRPSSLVGLNPGLVATDVTKGNGVVVGLNPANAVVAAPGTIERYQWYAGDLSLVPKGGASFAVAATPVEFGGANLMPADVLKQGQKGLVGALSIMPQGSTWTENDVVTDHQRSMSLGFLRRTRTSATIAATATAPATRDFVAVIQPGLNLRYAADGAPVEGIAAEGVISEDAEDAGQLGINYGAEPLWYRFGLAPNVPLTGGGGSGLDMGSVPNANEAYSNGLASSGGEDPSTAVFTAAAGQPFRLHTLVPAGHGRASVFNLHGHVWQRAPYMCPGSAYLGLSGNCKPTGFYPTLAGAGGPFEVGSRALGLNPLSMYFGGQDSLLPAGHFDFVLPSAGGVNKVKGDYLFRDQASFGNTHGLWGILRVQ